MNIHRASRQAFGTFGAFSLVVLTLTACDGGGSSTSGGQAGSPAGGGGSTTATGGGGSGGSGASGGSGGSGASGGSAGSGGEACGNGVVEGQETCDTAIAAGAPGACVTSCNDGASCTQDTVQNAGTCQAACAHDVITTCAAGDGCCPAGCTFQQDTDCSQTCGNGSLESGEECDTAIVAGQFGACPTGCDDGVACTTDTLINAGTCGAQCAHADVVTCVNGDGCCTPGCPADTDCAPLSRIKQSVITPSGQEAWSHNGFWDGTKYTGWTSYTGQSLTQIVPQLGDGQSYRGIDHVVLADGRVKVTLLQMDGTKSWSRYGTWDGSGYSSWTAWSDQFGNLSQVIPSLPAGQSYRSYDHVVFPDGKIKQTLLASDGKKVWQRYGTWNGSSYATWTDWSDAGGDLTQLLPNQGSSQSFLSFNHALLADTRLKQSVLTEDGHTIYYRYAMWDGAAYGNWTVWSSQFGDLTQLLPGKGDNQAYIGIDEAALAGGGFNGGCQNGCDDGDPCTVDSCTPQGCVHAAMSCDDGDGCTTDYCTGGACQHGIKSCDDNDGCTNDYCAGGSCQHSAVSCDDNNPCTDDSCSGGCQHSFNNAPCAGGGQCQNGSCPGTTCQCSTGCDDGCGNACNNGAPCAANAVCQDAACLCAGGPFCGGGCCPAGYSCNGANCCPPDSVICQGKCGTVTHACGKTVACGGCPSPAQCCPGNYCDEFCQ